MTVTTHYTSECKPTAGKEQAMWEKFNTENYTLYEMLQIIDDAMCYLFEFKVENGNLYYREFIG